MILVSACLAGEPVRYDAKSCPVALVQRLLAQGLAKSICPECLGGLPTPRLAAEIQGGSGEDVLAGRARVIDATGEDVTAAFIEGAHQALRIVKLHNASAIVLKENSPSCGSHFIYNGHFNGQKQVGLGVTAALLKQYGFDVLSEHELEDWLNQQLFVN